MCDSDIKESLAYVDLCSRQLKDLDQVGKPVHRDLSTNNTVYIGPCVERDKLGSCVFHFANPLFCAEIKEIRLSQLDNVKTRLV